MNGPQGLWISCENPWKKHFIRSLKLWSPFYFPINAQEMKFSIKSFFIKFGQILQIFFFTLTKEIHTIWHTTSALGIVSQFHFKYKVNLRKLIKFYSHWYQKTYGFLIILTGIQVNYSAQIDLILEAKFGDNLLWLSGLCKWPSM